MKKLAVILALSTLSIAALVVSAPAQDELYLTEPTVVDMAKVLPRYDAALWNLDFRDNPALLTLDCPYEFIGDVYYLGGHRHISSDAVGRLLAISGPIPAFSRRASEMDFYAHGLGGDAGFALKLNDRTSLAAIFGYRWNRASGEGDFEDNLQRFGIPNYGYFIGSTEEDFNGNTFNGSLLLSSVVSDTVTFGAGLKFGYTRDRYESTMSGFGVSNGFLVTGTESAEIDRNLTLRYYRLGPVFGISMKPSAMLKIDASLEAGFYMGDVLKDSSYLESFTGALSTFLFRTPTMAYTEDFGASDLSGWDLSAKVNPEITLSDALSVPMFVAFNYRDFGWNVGGESQGLFAPFTLLEFALGPGQVDYDYNDIGWDIGAGAGIKYRADWGVVSGLLSYAHRDFSNSYALTNFSSNIFDRRDRERRDILSLGIVYEKEFSPMLAADLGARYDIGWGHREIHSSLRDFFEYITQRELLVTADDRDMYQDLTLTTHLTLTPMDHLSVALGGMVKIPLDSLDYDMDGSSSGLGAIPFALRPAHFFGGPFSMGYESTGWDWGGLLSVTYEFGCPVATPPPAPPAPVIEPKLEPMTMK